MLTLFTHFFFKLDQALDLSYYTASKKSHQQQSLGAGAPFEDEEDSMCSQKPVLLLTLHCEANGHRLIHTNAHQARTRPYR